MTTQPAGEQHTGNLQLTGEGQPNQGGRLAARVIREHEPRPFGCVCGAQIGDSIDRRWHLVNATLEAAAPAIRQQVAEEIAVRADQIAENYQATALAHRDLSDPETPKGQRHTRTAHAFRNKADGAWAVAHAVREIGGKA